MATFWDGIAELAFFTFFLLMVVYRLQLWDMSSDADYRVWQYKAATTQYQVVPNNPNP